MRRLSLFFVLGAVLVLSSCLVGPRYKRPPVDAPAAFRGQDPAQSASIADLPWWSVFQDPDLQQLIQAAVVNNRDLRVAAARVEQARQLAAQSHSQYLPQIAYEAGLSGGKNESLGNPASTFGAQQGTIAAILQASWEADVWGRIRRSNEYAVAVYLATEQGRRGVLLSLVSSVAQAYFELLELDLRLDIAHRNVESFQGSLDIFQKRLDGGAASRLETSRAQAALSMVAANIPDLERQIAIQENEVRILLGSTPGPIARKGKLLEQVLPPEVPSGLPSNLLERRPDLLEAEQNIRAANARVGIADADFFPRLGLTTLLGRGSSPLAALVSGQTNIWSVAATLTGPIYQGGALRARQREAVAVWEQARNQYEQIALGAFRDVSNALITRDKLELVRARQMEAVSAYEDAVTVSLQRYNAGKSSYYEVLEAQQELYPAQNALAQTELNRRLAIVQLYQALGGGWKLADAQWSTPPQPAPSVKP
ncbi:MAG TPA: efflux transporter outer membrane subunit [Bryobacteraceae bacterium]|nr:efflux transporter outer membrane subunit [Bryobacteraceae bacterium]